jgi:hypothetical protein
MTLAIQPGGLQSQSQAGTQALGAFTSPHQVPQAFVSLSYTPIQMGFTPISHSHSQLLLSGTSQFHASYSELTGQPTPSYTTTVTSISDVSAQ